MPEPLLSTSYEGLSMAGWVTPVACTARLFRRRSLDLDAMSAWSAISQRGLGVTWHLEGGWLMFHVVIMDDDDDDEEEEEEEEEDDEHD